MEQGSHLSARRVLLALWKLVVGALLATTATLGIPAIRETVGAYLWIGMAMIAAGIIVGIVSLLDRKSYEDRSERVGHMIGAAVVAACGVFLAGLVPVLPGPGAVAGGLQEGVGGLISAPVTPPPPTAQPLRTRLVVRAEAGAESFAGKVEQRLRSSLRGPAAAANTDALQVSALASGRMTSVAAGHYQGRLDVRVRRTGQQAYCEYALTSTGVRTLDGAALQLADQLSERLVAFVSGGEQC